MIARSRARRRVLVGVAAAVTVAGVGVGSFAAFGGFDAVSRQRVAAGEGVGVVEVRLVDQGLGYDVRPDVVEVEPGARVVLDVVNDATGEHDLAVDDGPRTRLLAPGESQRLDLGTVDRDAAGDAWCTVGDHRVGGMTLDIQVT